MRLLCLLLAASLLAACPPVRSDDDDSACATEVLVCATYNGEPSPGSASLRSGPSDEEPLQSPLGSDGCVAFAVAAGSWEWQASHASDTCVSSYEPVEVEACAIAEVTVELINWCFDG